ncbi:MAG: lyase family protein [Promethearchaeota archaeon]
MTNQIENENRIESDLLGKIEVPTRALYGAQTRRAQLNFPVDNEKTIGDYPNLIEGLMLCKKAAAQVNYENGYIRKEQGQAIIKAAQIVLDKKMYNQFPIHYLHGGGGTSGNMNANEVLANIAEEILGGTRGQYKLVHPNEHVNLHQSTNDAYPTACHIAIILKWSKLKRTLKNLIATFNKRADELKNQKRIARTCLQDAVDITFKNFLEGYVGFLKRASERIESAVNSLYTVNLGGTIVGRKSDVPEIYLQQIGSALVEVTKDPKYQITQNFFDAAQNPDEMANVSSQLAILAQGLIKIAQDFRLMASGPETGLNEINLPAVQPGSSIMPSKINPVIPEFLTQICFLVIGLDTACQTALSHGEFDLNVWESLLVFNILDSMELLRKGLSTFDEKCVQDFKVNVEKNTKNANSIVPLLTRLTYKYGYSKINEICKQALGDNEKLKKLLRENRLE